MEFYSNTKPQLTNFKLQKDIYKVDSNPRNYCIVNDNITNLIVNMYKNYIEPNFLLILMISIICFILYQRYTETKKNKSEQFNEKTDVDDILDKLNEENNRIINPGIGNIPTLNPLNSIESQQAKNFPINVPINITGDNLSYPNVQTPQQSVGNMYDFNYNYNNVHENPSRNYYSGNVNTYQNAQDTTIQNPYGYLQNYNTSTNDFGKYATENNNDAIINYNEILNTTNNNLINNLQNGSLNFNDNIPENTMEPPYATE